MGPPLPPPPLLPPPLPPLAPPPHLPRHPFPQAADPIPLVKAIDDMTEVLSRGKGLADLMQCAAADLPALASRPRHGLPPPPSIPIPRAALRSHTSRRPPDLSRLPSSDLVQRTSAMSDNLVCVRNSLTDIMEADAGHVPRWVLNLYATGRVSDTQRGPRPTPPPHPPSPSTTGTRRRPSART